MDKEMFQWLKEFAPKAWELALREVWINVWIVGVGLFLSLSAFIFTIRLAKRKEWDEPAVVTILFVLGVFVLTFALIFFFEAIPMMLNPGFHALEYLKP